MSFIPVVTLTAVARDNSTFELTDATPTDNVSGYGSANAPVNQAAIISFFGMYQPYSELPIQATGYTGTLAAGMTFTAPVKDGVNDFFLLFGVLITLSDYTVSDDGLTLNTTDPTVSALLDGISYLSLDGVLFPVKIASAFGGQISLVTPLPLSATGTSLYGYYSASVKGMTLNNGEARVINGISILPIEVNNCENTQNLSLAMQLMLAAEIAFNCGLLAKAHEAGRLLSGDKPVTTTPCENCG